jgi:hypothetical protein
MSFFSIISYFVCLIYMKVCMSKHIFTYEPVVKFMNAKQATEFTFFLSLET